MALARYWQPEEEMAEAAEHVRRLSEEERTMLKRIIDRAKPQEGWGFSW